MSHMSQANADGCRCAFFDPGVFEASSRMYSRDAERLRERAFSGSADGDRARLLLRLRGDLLMLAADCGERSRLFGVPAPIPVTTESSLEMLLILRLELLP